jgi:hypothetical protein
LGRVAANCFIRETQLAVMVIPFVSLLLLLLLLGGGDDDDSLPPPTFMLSCFSSFSELEAWVTVTVIDLV